MSVDGVEGVASVTKSSRGHHGADVASCFVVNIIGLPLQVHVQARFDLPRGGTRKDRCGDDKVRIQHVIHSFITDHLYPDTKPASIPMSSFDSCSNRREGVDAQPPERRVLKIVADVGRVRVGSCHVGSCHVESCATAKKVGGRKGLARIIES